MFAAFAGMEPEVTLNLTQAENVYPERLTEPVDAHSGAAIAMPAAWVDDQAPILTVTDRDRAPV